MVTAQATNYTSAINEPRRVLFLQYQIQPEIYLNQLVKGKEILGSWLLDYSTVQLKVVVKMKFSFICLSFPPPVKTDIKSHIRAALCIPQMHTTCMYLLNVFSSSSPLVNTISTVRLIQITFVCGPLPA